jgi:hypothetical protein
MNKLRTLVAPYAKAVVPVAVGGVLWVLSQVGVTATMTIEEAATLLVTAALVWLVPNRN